MSSFQEKLLEIRNGDREALDALLIRWRPFLKLHARSLIDPRFAARLDSSDLVQDTLTQAMKDAQDFRGNSEGEWVQWLRRILIFQASKLRRMHLADKRNVRRETENLTQDAATSKSDPLNSMVAEDQLIQLAAAIEQLSPNMKIVVTRRVFRQDSFEEIAEGLNCSPGAARVTWTRAIRKLRSILRNRSDNWNFDERPIGCG